MPIKPSDLIEAQLEGVSFDRMLHAISTKRDRISRLPEDQLDFIETMVKEVEGGVAELREAAQKDDLESIRTISKSLQEIFQMLEDSCDV